MRGSDADDVSTALAADEEPVELLDLAEGLLADDEGHPDAYGFCFP
jgi:hypothetical protein